MQPNIDAPTGDADHVVLRALPVSQLRPTAASPSPCGATLNGLSWGRSDLDRSSSNAWAALDLLSPIQDRQGPRGFVLSVPDAVTVRLISWTLKELWNNQSASAIPTKSRNTSRSVAISSMACNHGCCMLFLVLMVSFRHSCLFPLPHRNVFILDC